MIEAVVGYPGNGKSFYCTYRAWKAIKKGKKVFTNYPVKGAYKITFQDLIDYTFPQNSMVIIDESGRWFNSRKWSDLPDEVFDLFTLHRHLLLDLLVSVQNFNRIDKALREVIELVWWARNILALPWFIYEGYYDVEHVGLKGEYQKRTIVSKFSRARKLYDTHAMSKTINKDYIPELLWDGFEDSEKPVRWYKKLFRKSYNIAEGSSSEGEEADPVECLACEVETDRLPINDDTERL